MVRVYTCTSCNLPKSTDAARGPLPRRCPDCNPKIDNGPKPPPKPKSNTISVKDTRPEGVAQQARVAQAITMRLEYKTWPEIAAALGWGHSTSAMIAVKREMERRRTAMDDTLDELRTREFDRLEALGREALRILNTDHYVVSGGTVVTSSLGTYDLETPRPLLDDGPKLQAINTLVKVSESLRRLLGLDVATKVDASVNVQYTIKGIPEDEMP